MKPTQRELNSFVQSLMKHRFRDDKTMIATYWSLSLVGLLGMVLVVLSVFGHILNIAPFEIEGIPLFLAFLMTGGLFGALYMTYQTVAEELWARMDGELFLPTEKGTAIMEKISAFAGTLTLVLSFAVVALVAALSANTAPADVHLVLLGIITGLGAGAVGVFASELLKLLSQSE